MRLEKIFRHYFVSGKHNKHKPHILRSYFIISILIISAFLFSLSYGSNFFFQKTVLGASIASNILVDLTNNDRLAENLVPLRINNKLNFAAELKNKDMLENSYFAHNSPLGLTPWHFLQLAGYNFSYAGENLAINFTEANEVENAWMKSPLHRANLLNPKFQEIGINVASGIRDGLQTLYIVQMFGTPAQKRIQVNQEVVIKETISKQLVKPVKQLKVKIINEDKQNSFIKNEDLATNTEIIPSAPTIAGTEKYSTVGERIFFETPYYVQYLFYLFLAIIGLALLLLTFAEFKKHHYKHIFYGASLILILVIFIVFNSSYI